MYIGTGRQGYPPFFKQVVPLIEKEEKRERERERERERRKKREKEIIL